MLNLFDEKKQIGLFKTETGRGNSVVFDIRWDVFVVRVVCLKFWDMRVRLGIVPVEKGAILPDFIAIAFDDPQ